MSKKESAKKNPTGTTRRAVKESPTLLEVNSVPLAQGDTPPEPFAKSLLADAIPGQGLVDRDIGRLTSDEIGLVKAFRQHDVTRIMSIVDQRALAEPLPVVKKPRDSMFQLLSFNLLHELVAFWFEPEELIQGIDLQKLFETIDGIIHEFFFEGNYKIDEQELINLINYRRFDPRGYYRVTTGFVTGKVPDKAEPDEGA